MCFVIFLTFDHSAKACVDTPTARLTVFHKKWANPASFSFIFVY